MNLRGGKWLIPFVSIIKSHLSSVTLYFKQREKERERPQSCTSNHSPKLGKPTNNSSFLSKAFKHNQLFSSRKHTKVSLSSWSTREYTIQALERTRSRVPLHFNTKHNVLCLKCHRDNLFTHANHKSIQQNKVKLFCILINPKSNLFVSIKVLKMSLAALNTAML